MPVLFFLFNNTHQLNTGSLYVRQSGAKLVEQMDQVSLSNGLCWALDNKTLYYIDSFRRLIYSFDYDVETGQLGATSCSNQFDFIANRSNCFPFYSESQRVGELE